MFRSFRCREAHENTSATEPVLTGIAAIMAEGRNRTIADPTPVPGATWSRQDNTFAYVGDVRRQP